MFPRDSSSSIIPYEEKLMVWWWFKGGTAKQELLIGRLHCHGSEWYLFFFFKHLRARQLTGDGRYYCSIFFPIREEWVVKFPILEPDRLFSENASEISSIGIYGQERV